MEKVSSSIAGVIMAGGKGTRFGQSGVLQPKCLLPVANNETLLSRQIHQLRRAEVASITVCCSQENHADIGAFLSAYRDSAGRPLQNVRAIPCPSTQLGPLPALAEVLSGNSAEWCLLCMADISFEQAPYSGLSAILASHTDIDGFVITGTDEMPAEGRGTGAVACEGKIVRAISYRPLELEQQVAREIRQWSGSFLFRAGLIPDLLKHVGEYHGAPYENWLQGLLDRGSRCMWIDAGPFVNVNSMREYEFLVPHTKDAHGN